jgi:formylglycine-generating enzyme required for sulfatase activity
MLGLDLKLPAAAAALVGVLACWAAALAPPATVMHEPEMIVLPPGQVTYRPAGDVARAGKPVATPFKTMRLPRGLTIMKHQVTRADYRRCVAEAGCQSIDRDPTASGEEPMVGVSWHDAQAYAVWLSRKTGRRYRLPTDEEWALAAGSRFHDEGWPNLEISDRAQLRLARYEQESAQEPVDKTPLAVGSFGANENGLLDVAGNVWEWSDTCFVRIALDLAGRQTAAVRNCGVRVVQGRHRAYVTDFIRDARAGGCAVGTPPANLGFRLVRDS